jgi:predicted nucleic acid-binding protein
VKGVYFADSFYWIALGHKGDSWHSRVAQWALTNASARFVTTEEVLTEVLNWFAAQRTNGRITATTTARRAMANPLTQVLPQTTAGFLDALAFYESRLDKAYSLVDCRSMLAMQSLGLTEVLSNDHHFTQEGFRVLFP